MEFAYGLLTGRSHGILILMRSCSLDEGFKSSSYLTETLLDPELGHAHEPNKTAFNKAHNAKEDIWNWFERPDNRLRLTRFGAAMNGLKNASPANAILEGSVALCCIISPLKYPKFQGTAGDDFLEARWLSMSVVVLARSP
jgi:hypothetical protein